MINTIVNLRRSGLFSLGVTWLLIARTASAAITPPEQPAEGPGSSALTYQDVTARKFGEGGTAYWLFEPAKPKPDSAPLMIFNHGWSAMSPGVYGAWIEHIVRRGNIVIFPVYQSSLRTPPDEFTINAVDAVQAGIERLQTEAGHVQPDLKHVAIVGHSMGGIISANLAALAAEKKLPRPSAVMCVEPGNTWMKVRQSAIKLEDQSHIPADTLLLTAVGDRDMTVRDIDAKRIFNETTSIPAENKNYILLISDEHGSPPLLANHFAPIAPDMKYSDNISDNGGRLLRRRLRPPTTQSTTQPGGDDTVINKHPGIDALDYFGTWKLFDGLTDAAFYGKNRKYALGNTPEQRFMGKWSDGTPVKELRVLDKP